MAERIRLDLALEQRRLAPSRARARDAVLRGTVSVNGIAASKPGQLVGDADRIAVDDPASRYVSRAALKLIAGLDAGGISVEGKVCLDVGASTGGFTQVLVERGALKVYAIDVGHGQLHASVAGNANVVPMEGVNARDLTREDIPEQIDLLVCDVSFVSITKVLAAPLSLCRAGASAVILIKPQFEVGRENVGRGGIAVEAAVDGAVAAAVQFISEQGWTLQRTVPSPILGGDGNKEIVALFRRG